MSRPGIRRRARMLLPALLAVAVLLRALVPAGYMVAGDGFGGLVVTICHGAGIAPSQMTVPSGDSRDGDGDGGSGVCVFAASTSGAPLPDFPRGMPAQGHWLPCVAPDGETLPHVPAILRAQSPRAPPARG